MKPSGQNYVATLLTITAPFSTLFSALLSCQGLTQYLPPLPRIFRLGFLHTGFRTRASQAHGRSSPCPRTNASAGQGLQPPSHDTTAHHWQLSPAFCFAVVGQHTQWDHRVLGPPQLGVAVDGNTTMGDPFSLSCAGSNVVAKLCPCSSSSLGKSTLHGGLPSLAGGGIHGLPLRAAQ